MRTRLSGLAHAIIVEEAHNLVGRASRETAEGSGNAAAEATAFVTRMLAEMRALGEGIVIADQLPTAVAPEVIRHTGTKVAARLVSREDRVEIGWSMLLDEAQIEEIARLAPGEAYVYADGFHVPRRTKTLDASTYLGLRGRYPAGMQLLEHLHEAPWFEGIVRADLEALSRRDAEWRAWLGNSGPRWKRARGRSWRGSAHCSPTNRTRERLLARVSRTISRHRWWRQTPSPAPCGCNDSACSRGPLLQPSKSTRFPLLRPIWRRTRSPSLPGASVCKS